MSNDALRNIALTIAYDGTDFFGFQSQAGTGLPTIQETLETAIYKLTGELTHVEGSGRTDTGVHARGQVVNFRTTSSIPPDRWKLALGQHLPGSVVIRDSYEAAPGFHARFDARSKTYIYQIYHEPAPSPFYARFSYHVPYSLDLEAMKKAASLFEGRHDFRAFCAAGSKVKSYVREIYACEVREDAPLIMIRARGNGFLTHMVRIIAGTLLEVGSGKRRPGEVTALIGLGDRRLAGATLPACGLILDSVEYGRDDAPC